MITVVRITGESYDLTTGQELPKCLVLSNGLREVAIQVSDEEAIQVIQLLSEGQPAGFNHAQVLQKNLQPVPTMTIAPSDEDLEGSSLPEDLGPGVEYSEEQTGTTSV